MENKRINENKFESESENLIENEFDSESEDLIENKFDSESEDLIENEFDNFELPRVNCAARMPVIGKSRMELTPGAKEELSVGERVRQLVVENDKRALPLPGDFKALSPERVEGVQPLTDNPLTNNPVERAVQRYLLDQGLSLETAVELGLGFVQREFKRTEKTSTGEEFEARITLPTLTYPFFVRNQLVSVKFRSCGLEQKPGKGNGYTKDWSLATQSNPELGVPPFHIDCIDPQCLQGQRVPMLVVTEGEKDCATVYEAGFPFCISVPSGASCDPDQYLKPFIPWLMAVDRIVLCGDSDLQGRRMVKALTEYLGSNALVVDLPEDCKDISEVALRYGSERVRRVLNGAHVPPTEAVVTLDQLRSQILSITKNCYDHGYSLGFGPLTDRVFRLDWGGGLVIVSGNPNSGKSDFLNALMIKLMVTHSQKCLFASFENPNKAKHYAHMLQLLLDENDLADCPPEIMQEGMEFLNAHMAHLDLQGETPTPDLLLEQADRYRRKSGLNYFVIDPYLFIQHVVQSKYESETEQIKRMLTRFQRWGQRYHVWVFIVAHPRKSQTAKGGYTSDPVSPDDIASSAHWKNLADFLFVIRRSMLPFDRFTELDMLKVRDQELCSPGTVYYVRRANGVYAEKPTIEACEAWYRGHEQQQDADRPA